MFAEHVDLGTDQIWANGQLYQFDVRSGNAMVTQTTEAGTSGVGFESLSLAIVSGLSIETQFDVIERSIERSTGMDEITADFGDLIVDVSSGFAVAFSNSDINSEFDVESLAIISDLQVTTGSDQLFGLDFKSWLDVQTIRLTATAGQAQVTGIAEGSTTASAFIVDSNFVFASDTASFVTADVFGEKTIFADFESFEMFANGGNVTVSTNLEQADVASEAIINSITIQMGSEFLDVQTSESTIISGPENTTSAVVFGDGERIVATAASGRSFVQGSGEESTVTAIASVDSLEILYGFDTITGGFHGDRLFGDGAIVELRALGGEATIAGGGNLNSVTADASLIANTILTGGDFIDGNEGEDFILGDSDILLEARAGTAIIGNGDENEASASAIISDSEIQLSADTISGETDGDQLFGDGEIITLRSFGGTATAGAGNNNTTIANASIVDNFIQTGNDTIQGNEGDDFIRGDSDIILEAIAGNAAIAEAIISGNTIIIGSDTISGGAGDDTILADGEVFEIIVSGSVVENNHITFGSDYIDAGDGNDTIFAGYLTVNLPDEFFDPHSNNTIEYGNDTIIGGKGDDVIYGGGGNDTAIYSADILSDPLRGFVDTNKLNSQQRADIISQVLAGTQLNYLTLVEVGMPSGIIIEDQTPDRDGRDTIVADVLTNNKNDSSTVETIKFGGEKYNLINGVATNNSDEAITGADKIAVYGKDLMVGGVNEGDAYIISGDFGDDIVIGSTNNGTLYELNGGSGRDVLIGMENNGPEDGVGTYNLNGGSGNDILIAGVNTAGNHYNLNGGSGRDILIDNEGDHTFTGGADSDTFAFDLGTDIGDNEITDFDTVMSPIDDDFLQFDNVGGNTIDDLEDISEVVNEGGLAKVEFGIDGSLGSILLSNIAFSGSTEISDYIDAAQITVNA